jgi:hypothetical protein
LTSLAFDLDSVLQVLFVTSGIEDVVSGGDGVVNDEPVGRLGGGGSGFRLMGDSRLNERQVQARI